MEAPSITITDQEMRDRLAAHNEAVKNAAQSHGQWLAEKAYWDGKVSALALDPIPEAIQAKQAIAERTVAGTADQLAAEIQLRDELQAALIAAQVIEAPASQGG